MPLAFGGGEPVENAAVGFITLIVEAIYPLIRKWSTQGSGCFTVCSILRGSRLTSANPRSRGTTGTTVTAMAFRRGCSSLWRRQKVLTKVI